MPASRNPRCRWCLGRKLARRRGDPRARNRGDDRNSATSTIAARRRSAAPSPASSAWSSTTSRTRSSSNWRSASSRPARAGLHSLSRQYRREPRPAAAGHPLDARARRRRTGAGARDRHRRSAKSKPLIAGLPVVQVMRRLPGLKASLVTPENQGGGAQGHRPSDRTRAHADRVRRRQRRRCLFATSGLRAIALALEEAGIPFDEALVIESTTNYAGGGAAAARIS